LPMQFGADALAGFTQDQQAIGRGMKQIDMASNIQRVSAKQARSGRDLGAIGSFAQTALSAANLSGNSQSKPGLAETKE